MLESSLAGPPSTSARNRKLSFIDQQKFEHQKVKVYQCFSPTKYHIVGGIIKWSTKELSNTGWNKVHKKNFMHYEQGRRWCAPSFDSCPVDPVKWKSRQLDGHKHSYLYPKKGIILHWQNKINRFEGLWLPNQLSLSLEWKNNLSHHLENLKAWYLIQQFLLKGISYGQ